MTASPTIAPIVPLSTERVLILVLVGVDRRRERVRRDRVLDQREAAAGRVAPDHVARPQAGARLRS